MFYQGRIKTKLHTCFDIVRQKRTSAICRAISKQLQVCIILYIRYTCMQNCFDMNLEYVNVKIWRRKAENVQFNFRYVLNS